MSSGLFSSRLPARRFGAVLSLFVFSFLIQSGFAQTKEDSLKTALNRAKVDTVRADLLVKLAAAYMSSDIAVAQKYAMEAIRLSESIRFLPGCGDGYRYLGNANYNQSKYIEAVENWTKSLAYYDTLDDKSKMSNVYANLGAAYESLSDDIKATEFNLKSLKVAEEIKDTMRQMYALTNMGAIYGKKSQTFNKALEYDKRAYEYAIKLKNNYLEGTLAANMGEIYFKQNKDKDALEYFEIAAEAFEGTENLPYVLMYIGRTYARAGNFSLAETYQNKALEIAGKLDLKRDIAVAHIGLANTARRKGDYLEAIKGFEKAQAILLEIGVLEDLPDAYQGLAQSYSMVKDYENAFKYQNLLTSIKDTLYNIQFEQRKDGLVSQHEIERKQNQISLLNKDKEIAEQLEKRQRFAKNASLVGLGLVVIILFIIFRNYRIKVKTNKILDQQKAEIEGLLLNILPQEVANELQRDGHATPMYYESVSVLFTDFKGFSSIAEGMSPRDLVTELNEYFCEFDDIIEKYSLEKIKTIGDAYMCAGGIPTANEIHPVSIVKAALEIQQYILQKNAKRVQMGITPWDLRIGIHTGPVVAGVVGRKKYAYDIWGNAVNIASRMESNGSPGKVNISAATYNLVKDKFRCTYRGKIEAKNIGIIDMYFVEGELNDPVLEKVVESQSSMKVLEA